MVSGLLMAGEVPKAAASHIAPWQCRLLLLRMQGSCHLCLSQAVICSQRSAWLFTHFLLAWALLSC